MSDVLVDGKKGTVEGYRANPDDTFYDVGVKSQFLISKSLERAA